jgi:hypothetical protein
MFPNNVWCLSSVYSPPEALLLVIVNYRSRLGVEGNKSFTERLDVVVGTLDERFSADVVDQRFLRRAILH